jgi:hypothetical protein
MVAAVMIVTTKTMTNMNFESGIRFLERSRFSQIMFEGLLSNDQLNFLNDMLFYHNYNYH